MGGAQVRMKKAGQRWDSERVVTPGADVAPGRVGSEQTPPDPRYEFD